MPALLERDGDGLTVKDAANGAYLHADPTWLAWFGGGAGDVFLAAIAGHAG